LVDSVNVSISKTHVSFLLLIYNFRLSLTTSAWRGVILLRTSSVFISGWNV